MSLLPPKTPAAPITCLLLAAFLVAPCAVAATFTVNSTLDSVDAAPGDGVCADLAGNCTLRAAIQESNALAGPDTIILGAGNYVLTIPGNAEQFAATGDLDIRGPLTLIGAGAGSTIIDANGIDRVFEIVNAGDVTISGVTLQNGVAGQNDPNYFVSQAGGAIFHAGSPSVLTLRDTVIRNCSATTGGAIFNVNSTLIIQNSTLDGNSATAGNGGAISESLASYVRIYNSTLSGNRATLSGGGLMTSNNAAVLNNVTITNNVADSDNNGSGDGGGINQGLTAPSLSNTIVAGNSDSGGQAPDCAGGIASAGYNLVGNNSGCSITPTSGDRIGTGTSPINPHLAPLADNGGPTPTHALLNGSPALNNGSPLTPGSGGGACETSDQRGIDRGANAPCDIGAYEYTPTAGATFTVNSALDQVDALPGDGRCETMPGNNVCTLRAAIQESNALIGPNQIMVPAGNYLLTIPGANENSAASGDLDITDDVTITGAGAAQTIIDGNGLDRVFDVRGGRQTTLASLTVRNGNVQAANDYGGGIYQQTGTLTVNDSVISGNKAGYGGGIYTVGFNTLTLNRSTVTGNTASNYGGGICNFTFASTQINGSTISANSAASGGALFNSFRSQSIITGSTLSNNSATYGGAILTQWGQGVVTLMNSTVSGNRAALAGGAISVAPNDTVNLRNATLTANRATAPNANGGGIYNSGTVNLRNSLIAANLGAGTNSPDCSGVMNSQGYNLLGDNTGCTFGATTGDQVGNGLSPIDPRLGPLADNGGPTFTHALLADSPALNAGNPLTPGSGGNACEALDQRGHDRVLNAPCDIGAVETVLADLGVTQSDTPDPVAPGGSTTYTVTVSNKGPEQADGLVLVDALPNGATLTGTGGGWTCTGNAPLLTCTLASLASGTASSVDITVTLPGTSGTYYNAASVSSATVDLNSADNSSSESTLVDAAPTIKDVGASSYVAGRPAEPIAPHAKVADSDSASLTGAVVQIVSGYRSGEDRLLFTATATITGAWNAGNGTLTLSGSAPLAAYQDALRSIAYLNTGTPVTAGVRGLSITVNDGSFNSAPAAGSVNVSIPAASPGPVINTPSPGATTSSTPPPTVNAPGVLGMAGTATAPADGTSQATTSERAATPEVRADTPTGTTEPNHATTSGTQSATEDTAADASAASAPRANTSAASAAGTGSNAVRSAAITPDTGTDTAGSASTYSAGTATLAPNNTLWRQLDNMKQQMQGALEERALHDKIVAGAAQGATLFVFAGTINWVLKSSNLLASLLSSLPLWAPFDPLAVLNLSRRERKRRKRQIRTLQQQDDAQYRKLGPLLDCRAARTAARKEPRP